MLIGQWRGYFFLNFSCEEGKITRFEIVDEEYIDESKDERKWKHEEKHGVLEQRFQEVGE